MFIGIPKNLFEAYREKNPRSEAAVIKIHKETPVLKLLFINFPEIKRL